MKSPEIKKIRIVIADKCTAIRIGVAELFRKCKDVVISGSVDDGMDVLKMAGRIKPDVIILGSMEPDPIDIKMIRLSGKTCPDSKVLVYSGQTDRAILSRIFRAGASGYLLKEGPAGEVIDAVRQVAKHGCYVSPPIARAIVQMCGKTGCVKPGNIKERITFRECQIFRLLAQGYTSKEAAGNLQLSLNTVKTHIKRARKKLRLKSNADIIRYAVQKYLLVQKSAKF